MSNSDTVNLFIETLLASPLLTMQAVQLRLSMTDYELVLKKADPLKDREKEWEAQKSFPFATAQKCPSYNQAQCY